MHGREIVAAGLYISNKASTVPLCSFVHPPPLATASRCSHTYGDRTYIKYAPPPPTFR